MKNMCEIVIHTNVVHSGLRSQCGASFLLLSLIGKGKFDVILSVPLVLEYEQALKQAKWKGKPPWRYIADILDYICLVGKERKIHFLWRPRERDPKDDMVLEVAVAAACDCIITYNKRDFPDAKSFGIELRTPVEFLKNMGELS